MFWPCQAVCRISVSQPGVKPEDIEVKAWNSNHHATREPPLPLFSVSYELIFTFKSYLIICLAVLGYSHNTYNLHCCV